MVCLSPSSIGMVFDTRLKRDLIFLVTNAGMLVVHTEDKALAGVKPVVKLSSLAIAGNVVYLSNGDYLEESIQQASSITLHEKDSRFTLELTTCNYGNNTRIRFAYRMKGYEEEWNETKPGDNLVRYTAVPPGRYILQIRATDETGRWSDQLTELQVHIVPYFYKSVWFYLALLVLGCIGVWILYRRKIYPLSPAACHSGEEGGRTHTGTGCSEQAAGSNGPACQGGY